MKCSACGTNTAQHGLVCDECRQRTQEEARQAHNEKRRQDYRRAAQARRTREDTAIYSGNPLRAEDLRNNIPLPPRVADVEDYRRELARCIPVQRERDLFERRLRACLRAGHPFTLDRLKGRFTFGGELCIALDLDPRLERVPQHGGRVRWRLREGTSPDLSTALGSGAGDATA